MNSPRPSERTQELEQGCFLGFASRELDPAQRCLMSLERPDPDEEEEEQEEQEEQEEHRQGDLSGAQI
jgi:hypothetical protein